MPSSSRRPFPEINEFRGFVTNELARRQETNFSEPSTPFMKMTACLNVNLNSGGASKYLTLGMHGYTSENDIFDTMYGDKDFVGYTYDNGKHRKVFAEVSGLPAVGQHPAPGVIGVNVNKRKMGAPFKTTVSWECSSLAQLEFLHSYFLTPGVYVVVEWGQNFSTLPVTKTLDFASADTDAILIDCILKGRDKMIDSFVEPTKGNYDFIVGKTSDFSISITPDNKYSCTTVIYSVGEAMFGIRTEESYTDTNAITVDRLVSLQQFFAIGGKLDYILANNSNDVLILTGQPQAGTLISKQRNTIKGHDKKHEDESHKEGKTKIFSAEDGVYVKWNFFIDTLVKEMLGFVNRSSVSPIYKFPLGATDKGPFVGRSQYLKSIDPAIMIISPLENAIRGDISRLSGPSQFGGATVDSTRVPQLEDETFRFNSTLSKGVWINVNAISHAFLSTSTFFEGFQLLLGLMNKATQNFWNLNLYFDDNAQQYHVIDTAFSEYIEKTTLAFHKFNNKSRSEVLNLDFQMSMTNEQRSQIYLTNYKTEVSSSARTSLTNNAIPQTLGNTQGRDFLSVAIQSAQPVTVATDSSGLPLEPSRADFEARLQSLEERERFAEEVLGRDLPYAGLPTPGQPLNSVYVSPVPITKDSTANQRFGASRDGGKREHGGYDISAPIGTPVRAIRDGVIASATTGSQTGGNQVTVRHVDGSTSTYSHLLKHDASLVGRRVAAGDQIGQVGMTGTTSGPHLHFQIRDRNGKLIDPLTVMRDQLRGRTPEDVAEIMSRRESASEISRSMETEIAQIQRDRAKLEAQVETRKRELASRIASNKAGGIKDNSALQSQLKDIEKFQGERLGASKKEEAGRIQETARLLEQKFGSAIRGYIEYNPDRMRALIALEGEKSKKVSNAFNFPLMTQMEITLTIQGLAGFSAGDAFHIDKIQRIYEQIGVFQVTGVEDTISETGWVTKLSALFKILWPRVQ